VSSFTSIHVPTDFTEGSHRAFEHALRLALDGQCALRLLHVGTDDRPPWTQFPGIRFTLEKWGALPNDSSKSDVVALGVKPSKYYVRTEKPVKAIVGDLKESIPDLVVMAGHARSGLSRLLHPSVCKQVARGAKLPTLLVPHGCDGFVDSESGECRLSKVLIPISPEVRPGRAVELAARLISTVQSDLVTARFIYVGEPSDMPTFDIPSSDRVQWESVCRQGDVLGELAEEVEEFGPELIVMIGRGRDSVMDFFMPGKIEKIATFSDCPLLIQNIA
jgi:nucleotide-binding universal stress UspA family protein